MGLGLFMERMSSMAGVAILDLKTKLIARWAYISLQVFFRRVPRYLLDGNDQMPEIAGLATSVLLLGNIIV